MNRLSNTDRSRVIACLVEGTSQRATVRITGIAKKTSWVDFQLIGQDQRQHRVLV